MKNFQQVLFIISAAVFACEGYLKQWQLCESKSSLLSCPVNFNIKIIYAYFGGPADACAASNYADATCKTTDSTDKLITLCNDKNSCTIESKSSVFGDPCPGPVKNLFVDYYCLETPSFGFNVFYVHGEGCDSPYVVGSGCLKSRCQRFINNNPIPGSGKRGIDIATVDQQSLAIIENKHFDTHSESATFEAWANTVADGLLVMACNRDASVDGMTTGAWQIMQQWGLKTIIKETRASFALIGITGKSNGKISRSMMTNRRTLPAVVSLAIVDSPSNAEAGLASNRMLNVIWNNTGIRDAKMTISYKVATTPGSVATTTQVNAELNKTFVGPLQSGVFNLVTVTYGISGETRYYEEVLFYVIADSSSLGCPNGVYKLIIEEDGNSAVFGYSSTYWENSKTYNERGVAFNDANIKTKEYSTGLFQALCVGVNISNVLRFINIPLPDNRKTFLALMTESFETDIDRSTWLSLLPSNKRMYLQQNCNEQGFKKTGGRAQTRFGILGNNENDCGTCDSYFGFGSLGIINMYPYNVIYKGNGYIFMKVGIDGGWTSWSSWSGGPFSCGIHGVNTRNRTCTNPTPTKFGIKCSGLAHESKDYYVDCPPPAPENARGEKKSRTRIKLSWDLLSGSTTVSPMQYYIVKLRLTTGQLITTRYLGQSSTSIDIYGLTVYTEYCFTVNVRLASGVDGNASLPYCLFTEESTPISPPTSFTGYNTSAWCLNFTWTAIPAAQARGIILGYKIYLDRHSNQQIYTTTAVTEFRICGLEPFKSYEVSIKGFTKFGEGGGAARSAWITVKTDENVPIAAPVVSFAGKTSTSIRITWIKLADDSWKGIPRGYKIFYQLSTDDGNTSTIDVDSWLTTAYELVELETFKEYNIWMAGYTSKGNGVNGTIVKGRTEATGPSRAPSAITARNSSSFSLVVHWRTLEEKYRLGILLGYRVFCANVKTGVETFTDVGANAIAGSVNDLKPFANHSIMVAAFNVKGFGPNSSLVYALTDQYVPSQPPMDVQGHNLSSSVIFLSWSEIPKEFRQGILLGYIILWKNTSNPLASWNESKVDSESFDVNITGLGAYTYYTFRIAGFTCKGDGLFSSDLAIISGEDAPRTAPALLDIAANSSSSAFITWNTPSDVPGIIRGYKVSYKAVYTADDFKSQLLVRKKRKKRAVISTPLKLNEVNLTFGADVHSANLVGLEGNTNYSIKILSFTIFEGFWSRAMYIKTPESEPGMSPMNVTATATSYHSIMVKWKHVPPAYAHGYINGFIVYYQKGNHSNVTSFNESQIAERTYLEITHLAIFQWHSFQVLAYTSAGLGVKSEVALERTKEWIPIKAPTGLNATSFYSPFQINVTWTPLPQEFWQGHKYKYELTFYKIAVGGVKFWPFSQLQSQVFTTNYTDTSFKFTTAETFAMYEIEVRAQTVVGDGPLSARIRAETCNIDRTSYRTSWIEAPPFATLHPKTVIPRGAIPKLLHNAMLQCSGTCASLNKTIQFNFITDGVGLPAKKSSYKELIDNLDTRNDFTFPMIKPRFKNQAFEYINLVNVPGAVLIEAKLVSTSVGTNIKSAINIVAAEVIVFVVFCWLSGVLIWALETWRATDEFEKRAIPGMFEGFYWAFQTATTVGYGDKAPSSIPGRIFMMVWALTGLVLVALLSGVLTSVLISEEEVVPAEAGGSKMKPSAVGVVVDTWEYYAVLQSDYKIGKNYTSLHDLIEGMKQGEVKYGIVGEYKSLAFQHEMKHNDISVKRVLKLEGAVGLYASGNARRLKHCIEKYTEENEQFVITTIFGSIQETVTKRRQEEKAPAEDTDDPLMSESQPVFFSWESKMMRSYIKTMGLTLCIFYLLGSIYEIIKRFFGRKKAKVVPTQQYDMEILQSSVPNIGFPEKSELLARKRWDIIRDIVLESANAETHEKHLESGIENNHYTKLKIQQNKWKSLKKERLRGSFHHQYVEYLKSLQGEQSRNPLLRYYQNVKRNIALASLNIPGTLERETDNLFQEFSSRTEKRLADLDSKHAMQLVAKREQILKRYGKFKYIKETELVAPY